MIRPAAQRFLHRQDRIEAFTGHVRSGSLHAVVGRLTVEEIIRDRAALSVHVVEEAERALTHQGLVLERLPVGGHPHRRLVPAGPRTAGGGPCAAGGSHRRGAGLAHRGDRADEGRGGDRGGRARTRPVAGGGAGRGRCHEGPIGGGRTAGRGGAAAGGPHGTAEG